MHVIDDYSGRDRGSVVHQVTAYAVNLGAHSVRQSQAVFAHEFQKGGHGAGHIGLLGVTGPSLTWPLQLGMPLLP